MADATGQQRKTLRHLGLTYRNACLTFSGDRIYSATRRDNHQVLTADSPYHLREKIRAHQQANPISREAPGKQIS